MCSHDAKQIISIEKTIGALAQTIATAMTEAREAGAKVEAFATQATGAMSASAVQVVLQGDDSERDSLEDLLLFPDEQLQFAVEKLLPAEGLSEEQADALAGRIAEQCTAVRLKMFGFPVEWTPDSGWEKTLIKRLRLTRMIPEGLFSWVEQDGQEELSLSLRRMLRRSRFEWNGPREWFLPRMGIAPADQHKAFLTEVEFVLRMYDEGEEAIDMWISLGKRKQYVVTLLSRARQYKAMLEKSNIETLRAKGVREPHLDAAELQSDLETIDAVGMRAYGAAPESFGPAENDLGDYDADDVTDIFNVFAD